MAAAYFGISRQAATFNKERKRKKEKFSNAKKRVWEREGGVKVTATTYSRSPLSRMGTHRSTTTNQQVGLRITEMCCALK